MPLDKTQIKAMCTEVLDLMVDPSMGDVAGVTVTDTVKAALKDPAKRDKAIAECVELSEDEEFGKEYTGEESAAADTFMSEGGSIKDYMVRLANGEVLGPEKMEEPSGAAKPAAAALMLDADAACELTVALHHPNKATVGDIRLSTPEEIAAGKAKCIAEGVGKYEDLKEKREKDSSNTRTECLDRFVSGKRGGVKRTVSQAAMCLFDTNAVLGAEIAKKGEGKKAAPAQHEVFSGVAILGAGGTEVEPDDDGDTKPYILAGVISLTGSVPPMGTAYVAATQDKLDIDGTTVLEKGKPETTGHLWKPTVVGVAAKHAVSTWRNPYQTFMNEGSSFVSTSLNDGPLVALTKLYTGYGFTTGMGEAGTFTLNIDAGLLVLASPGPVVAPVSDQAGVYLPPRAPGKRTWGINVNGSANVVEDLTQAKVEHAKAQKKLDEADREDFDQTANTFTAAASLSLGCGNVNPLMGPEFGRCGGFAMAGDVTLKGTIGDVATLGLTAYAQGLVDGEGALDPADSKHRIKPTTMGVAGGVAFGADVKVAGGKKYTGIDEDGEPKEMVTDEHHLTTAVRYSHGATVASSDSSEAGTTLDRLGVGVGWQWQRTDEDGKKLTSLGIGLHFGSDVTTGETFTGNDPRAPSSIKLGDLKNVMSIDVQTQPASWVTLDFSLFMDDRSRGGTDATVFDRFGDRALWGALLYATFSLGAKVDNGGVFDTRSAEAIAKEKKEEK